MIRAALLAALLRASLVAEADRLLPPSGPDARGEVIAAAEAVTDDARERLILTRLARWESHYRRDVAECRRKGAAGELGPWQVIPRSREEAAELCASVEASARVALRYIRESERRCRHLPPLERGAAYARASCDSAEGRRMSRVRWAP